MVRVGLGLDVELVTDDVLVVAEGLVPEDELVRLTEGGVTVPVVGLLPEQDATAIAGSAATHTKRAWHLPGPRGIPHCA